MDARAPAATLLRSATDADVDRLVVLINAAYQVEKFFIAGDRTDAGDLRARMQRGEFLVLEPEPSVFAGCVFVSINGSDGFMGMLSVSPERQGQGIGTTLAIAAEDHCRSRGCTRMEIEVVNLRTELPPFYRRLGYEEAGERPFPDATRATRACHFVVMRKSIRTGEAAGRS